MERRPRIGIVGEIYVKFSPIASNDIVRSIEANGGEAETSGMLDFFLYGLLDSHFQWKHLDGTFSDNLKDTFGRYLLEWYRRPLEKQSKFPNVSTRLPISRGWPNEPPGSSLSATAPAKDGSSPLT